MQRKDKYFNVNFICAANNNEWSNHALMSMQLLLNQHIKPKPLLQTTNDRGVCEETPVPGCVQTTLAALAKRQFGGLERHLCHTLELGRRREEKRTGRGKKKQDVQKAQKGRVEEPEDSQRRRKNGL